MGKKSKNRKKAPRYSMEKTKHHIFPQSRKRDLQGCEFAINSSENIKRIKDDIHCKLHNLLSNATPKEQLNKYFRLTADILSDEVNEKIREILETPDNLFYNPKLLKH